MNVVGLDIGGANIKAAGVDGRTTSEAFALWKDPVRLSAVLRDVLARFSAPDVIAITMTAELADCFDTKRDGVHAVLDAVIDAGRFARIVVWQTGAEFVETDVAKEIPLLVAAANWHALATWAGRLVTDEAGLLVDVGSTTVDIIPLHFGVPATLGMTDCERLQAGELVYSGVRRTPVCAVAHAVPFGRAYCPLAAELFATTLDVYLLLGKIPENATDTNTADGRSATIAAAHQRLARAVCCDQTELPIDQARSIARFLADVQRQRINGALAKVLSRRPFTMSNADSRESEVPTTAKPHVVISGSGSFLASHVIRSNTTLCDVTVTDLSELLNCSIAETACAFAVARLAQERIRSLN